VRPYIYIHVPQTGGTSLEHILNGTPHKKSAAELYPEYTDAEWKQLFVFSLIRNPYDRAVALYLERYYANAYGMLEDDVSFSEFLELTLILRRSPYFDNWSFYAPQKYWLENKFGRVVVPHLYPFEQYDKSVRRILKKLGHPSPDDVEIPHIRNVGQPDWRPYYLGEDGRKAAHIVQTVWEDDFKYLNYTRKL